MDLIDRSAAIDAIRRDANPFLEYAATQIEALPSAQPYTDEEIQKMQEVEQAEINKAFELGRASAEAEIIRCKDCKYRDPEDKKCDCGHDILWQLPRDDDWFCADAERREDEAD